MPEIAVTNARIVLRNEVVRGSLSARDGVIDGLDLAASSLAHAVDFDGDLLLPGMVELHTDNLEKHIQPRPGVHWPPLAAVCGHDAQVIASGITTVLDAVSAGDIQHTSARIRYFREMIDSVRTAQETKMCRAEHHLHVRCEVGYEHVIDLFAICIDDPLVKLVSVMDHTPGQRQFADTEKYRAYYKGRYALSDHDVDAMIARQKAAQHKFADRHRSAIVSACHERGVPIASHDDASSAHVEMAARDGIAIAEFPTTVEAAEAACQHGMDVLAGAPNLVLGGSHSGNVSVRELAERGLVSILSSDYVPSSMLYGAFLLRLDPVGLDLPEAVRLVSTEPAERIGFRDRGEIDVGKRADFLRVREGSGGVPIVCGVWREGVRVA